MYNKKITVKVSWCCIRTQSIHTKRHIPFPDIHCLYCRELAVRRTIDKHTFLWDLMNYVCTYKPCFVTVSLLIRCHLGTLLTAWGKAIDGPARCMPREMEATERVMCFLVKVRGVWLMADYGHELLYQSQTLRQSSGCSRINVIMLIWPHPLSCLDIIARNNSSRPLSSWWEKTASLKLEFLGSFFT